MSDLSKRLRAEGKDAFAKHYSLGMFKLCTEAADEIDRLERRVTALEMIIGEDLLPWDCSDDMNRMLVEDIHLKRNAALADEKGAS